jgi:5-(carboxyamino)imidazole ribonucleotide synthase
MSAILPPSTIGLLGGGQLGRMTALAARAAGFRVAALDPDPQCAIRSLVEEFVPGSFSDAEAAATLAKNSQVVTFEIEKISLASLEAAARYAPVRPGPALLHLIQNRLRQKQWLARHGFPVGAFHAIHTLDELKSAAQEFPSSFVKVAEGGYDGRGQTRLHSPAEAETAWNYLGGFPSIAEKALDLDYEISVLVARSPSGELQTYAPAMNHHENQILVWSVIPAPIPDAIAARAQEIASDLASALALEGILVAEMFITKSSELLINELAPRPHNSYHASTRACVTGQFEQLVRAICDLPLGSPEVIRPAAIVNLLGDLWFHPDGLDLAAALRVPEARLHLYDKEPRPGRKVGHLSATGATPGLALQSALAAKAALHGQAAQQTNAARDQPSRTALFS